jgi:hypothetical protein
LSLARTLVISVKVRSSPPSVVLSAWARRLALAAIIVLKQRKRRLKRQFLPINVETQAGNRFIKQPVPRRPPRHRLFVQQLLQLVIQLVGLLAQRVVDPRLVMSKRFVP